MKPFDLEAFKNGAVALDSANEEALFIGFDRYKIITYEYLYSTQIGKVTVEFAEEYWKMKPKPKVKKTGWIAVYKVPCTVSARPTTTDIYKTKERLLGSVGDKVTHEPFQITWEEDAK